MAYIFDELMAFFGITGTPVTFADFVPWMFRVLCALGLFMFAWYFIKGLVSTVTRTRY